MIRQKLDKIDAQILEILEEAADQSCDDQTIWIDTDGLTFIVMDKFTRGSRQFIHRRLVRMRQRGIVERRVFHQGVGWKLVKKSGKK